MRGGVILIALALLIGYLGVSGRYKCFALFVSCMGNPELAEGFSLGGSPSSDGSGGQIVVTPNSGVNPTGAPIYDARNYLPPIEFLL